MRKIAGRYRIVGQLGEGGMGAVLEVEHEVLTGRRYAAKVLRAEHRRNAIATARLLREARAAAALQHPSIVGVQDFLEDAELGPVLLMERLHGESLAAVATRGPLGGAHLRWIALQVLSGLAAAHALGLVHRDIKPSNLFVERGPGGERLRILDFGLVWEESSELTRPGVFLGTQRYASPEQVVDEALGPATDLYGLGATLLFLATGQTIPMREATAGVDPGERLSTLPLPPGWSAILGRALQPDPARRFTSADEMAAAVRMLPAEHVEPLLGGDVAAAPLAAGFDRTFVGPARPSAPSGGPSAGPSAESTMEPVSAGSAVGPRRRRRLLAAATLLALVALGAWWVARPPAGETACRTLAVELSRRQRPNGGFAGIEQVAAAGWDTAQQLTALRAATEGCSAPVGPSVERASAALAAYHRSGGWSAATPAEPHALATAWGVLADPSNATAVAELKAYQQADGAFRTFGAVSTPHAYATVLGAWALLEAGDPAAAAALEWLAAAVADPVDIQALRLTPGLDEQIGWTLLRGGHPPPDGLAERILRRAEQAPYPDGRIPFPQVDASELFLVTQGEPWAVLAATALARRPELDGSTRRALRSFARERRRSWDAQADLLRSQPGFMLAERVLAAVPRPFPPAPAQERGKVDP